MQFNLSHSGECTLVAVAQCGEVGVDLECVRRLPDLEEMADCCFSAGERATFHALPANDRLKAFFNCWTRREAFVMALGDGLARPLDSFEVSLTPGQQAKLLQIDGDYREASRWTLRGFSVMPGTVAAVAIERPVHANGTSENTQFRTEG
jgi:4'-phosphopantetheinyl transferase